jgi:hypothetical protein
MMGEQLNHYFLLYGINYDNKKIDGTGQEIRIVNFRTVAATPSLLMQPRRFQSQILSSMSQNLF